MIVFVSKFQALVNMSGVFELFETDKDVQKRINKIVEIFKNKSNTLYLLDEKVREYN